MAYAGTCFMSQGFLHYSLIGFTSFWIVNMTHFYTFAIPSGRISACSAHRCRKTSTILVTVTLPFTPPSSNPKPQAARPAPSPPTGTSRRHLQGILLPTPTLHRAALRMLLLPVPTLVCMVRTPMASGSRRRPTMFATQGTSVESHSSGRCK